MNTRRVSAILNTFLTAIVFLAGCSKQPAQGVRVTEVIVAIKPGVYVGQVHSGMTLQQVIAALGQPDDTNNSVLDYVKLGLQIIPGKGDIVHIVGIGYPFLGGTKEGIFIGSSRNSVIQAYGEPTSVVQLKPGYEVLKYKTPAVNFQLHDGKVDWLATLFPITGQ